MEKHFIKSVKNRWKIHNQTTKQTQEKLNNVEKIPGNHIPGITIIELLFLCRFPRNSALLRLDLRFTVGFLIEVFLTVDGRIVVCDPGIASVPIQVPCLTVVFPHRLEHLDQPSLDYRIIDRCTDFDPVHHVAGHPVSGGNIDTLPLP